MIVKNTITLNQCIFIFGQSLTKTLEEMDINCPLKLAIQLKKTVGIYIVLFERGSIQTRDNCEYVFFSRILKEILSLVLK